MQSSLTHHTATRKALEIIVPASEVGIEYNEVINKVSAKVKIPGFRPSKAPKDIILSRYEREIKSDVAQSLIQKYFMRAAESCNVHPISQPVLKSMELGDSSDGKFNILFDVAPEVVVPEYVKIKITKKKRLINEDDVTEQLEYIRQQTAKFMPFNGGVAQLDHYVTMDVTVKPQGLKAATYKDQVIQLTADRPFDAEILNMKVGETKDFSITVPTDDSNNAMAGKTVSYKVTLNDLRIRELSEINDDFAKDLGVHTTLEELKASIRIDLEDFSEKDAISRVHQSILENMLDNTSFEVPDSMVALQLNEYCQEFAQLISKQGIDPKKINWEAYRKGRANEAERVVRSSYILEYIGNAENIEVSDQEVNNEIANLIKERKIQQPFTALRKKMEDDGTINEIKGRVRTSKTLNHILSLAEVTEELLDKDAFTALVESESGRNANSSKTDHNTQSVKCDDIEKVESEHHNNNVSLTKGDCHNSTCDHNHNETIA